MTQQHKPQGTPQTPRLHTHREPLHSVAKLNQSRFDHMWISSFVWVLHPPKMLFATLPANRIKSSFLKQAFKTLHGIWLQPTPTLPLKAASWPPLYDSHPL